MAPKKKQPEKKASNLKMVVLFFAGVFILLLASAVLRIISLIQESAYDGSHIFTIQIISDLPKKNMLTVISFAPDKDALSLLEISSDKKMSTVVPVLAMPIDASVRFKNDEAAQKYLSQSTLDSKISYFLFNYSTLDTQLNIVDLVRLFLFSKSVPSNNITTRQLSLPASEVAMDKLSSSLFSDASMTAEKLTIEVINGSEVSGLGSRLARFLTNTGANVISVKTADKGISTSEISCSDEKTYTCLRLHTILGFPLHQHDTQEISDVIIKIGKDKIGKLPL